MDRVARVKLVTSPPLDEKLRSSDAAFGYRLFFGPRCGGWGEDIFFFLFGVMLSSTQLENACECAAGSGWLGVGAPRYLGI